MSDSEFFRETQWQWYSDFVDAELYNEIPTTSMHDEIFEFEPIPF